MKKHFITRTLFATAIVFLTATISFGQCVIPITDGQSYFESFEGDGFDCWSVESYGDATWAPLVGTNSTVVSFSYQNTGDEARLVSPVFDLSGVGGATFSFSYAMMGIYEQDEMEVSYRSSEADGWHLLGTFSLSDYNNFFEETYELENLSSTYQVSFLGRGLGGMYIFVDNVEIASTSGCARPVGLQATEVTSSTALLGWSTNGNEEGWTLDLNGNVWDIDSQPFLIENLRPLTDYTFRVKAHCGNGSESEWATPITFRTLCDVIVVTDDAPYFDDFEASDDFVCWKSEIMSGNDGWVIDPGYLIVNNTAFFIWLGDEAMLSSTTLDISAVTNPTLTFKHREPFGQGRVDELSVWYATHEGDSWHNLGYYTSASSEWETVTLALPNPSSTYYIGFKGKSYNAEGVYVDDVAVGALEVVGVGESGNTAVSVSPNPTNGKVAIETGDQTGEVAVFDTMGRQIAVATVAEGRVEIDLGHCAKGVYVVRIITTSGTTTVKLVKE